MTTRKAIEALEFLASIARRDDGVGCNTITAGEIKACVETILPALQTQIPEWQPIEAAPRDEIFLGYDPDVGMYVSCIGKDGIAYYHWNHKPCPATHWKHLPKPQDTQERE